MNKNTSVIIVTKSGTVYIGHLDKDQDLRYLLEVPPTTGVVVLNDAHVKTPAFFSPVAMVCVAAMQIESFSVLID
ncbi:MAG: hypothetical protein WCG02_03005 [Candidatus Taylorbacteria bacterium]